MHQDAVGSYEERMAVIDGAIAHFKEKFNKEEALLAYFTSTWEHKKGMQLLAFAAVEDNRTGCTTVVSVVLCTKCAPCQET
jgi:hypothetical protein